MVRRLNLISQNRTRLNFLVAAHYYILNNILKEVYIANLKKIVTSDFKWQVFFFFRHSHLQDLKYIYLIRTRINVFVV